MGSLAIALSVAARKALPGGRPRLKVFPKTEAKIYEEALFAHFILVAQGPTSELALRWWEALA